MGSDNGDALSPIPELPDLILDNGCWYDPVEHMYGRHEEHWPSVTQVLKLAGKLDTQFFTELACARGTLVHLVTASIERRWPYDAESLTVVGGYIEAHRKFLRDTNPTPLLVEQPVFSINARTAGTPDRVYLFPKSALLPVDGPVLVDIKTGGPQDWHRLQLAAYAWLLKIRMGAAPLRAALYLRPDGTYRFKMHTDPLDTNEFFEALDLAWERWDENAMERDDAESE